MLCRIAVLAAALWASTTPAHAHRFTHEGDPIVASRELSTAHDAASFDAGQLVAFSGRSTVPNPSANAGGNIPPFSKLPSAQSAAGSDTLARMDYYKLDRSTAVTADDAALFDGETVRRILHFSDLSPGSAGQGQVSLFAVGTSESFDRIQLASRGTACHIDERAGPFVLPEPGTFGLLAAGLLFAGAVARRRMRH
jgi:hypothetical protein